MGDEVGGAKVRIDPDLSYFRDKLNAALQKETGDEGQEIPIKPNIDGPAADKAKAEVDGLGKNKTVKIKPEIDDSDLIKAKTQEELLGEAVGKANENLEKQKEAADAAKQGMSGLITAAIGLGPALDPIGATLIAGVGALLPVLLAAGAGLGAFALAAAGSLGPLEAQAKAVLSAFQKLAAPDVIPVVHQAASLIVPIFATLMPLVKSTSGEMEHLLTAAHDALTAPFWQGFISFIGSQAGPAINSLTGFFGGFVKAIAGVTMAFAPFVTDMESGLTRVGAAVASWGQGLSTSSGFASFMNYVKAEGPVVLDFLKNFWDLAKNLVVGLAPIGAAVLTIVTGLTDFLNAVSSINPVLTTTILSVAGLAFAYSKLHDPVMAAIGGIQKAVEVFSAFKAALAGGEMADALATFGDKATQSAVGIAGLVESLGGLGPVLGVAAVALAGAAALGIGLWMGFHGAVSQTIAEVEKLPTTTLPQMSTAMAAAQAQIDKTRSSTDQLTHSFVNAPGAANAWSASLKDNSNVVDSLTGYIQKLRGEQTIYNDNLGALQQKYGLTRSSAEALAGTLNIDLSKALNPTQIVQFGAALQEQAAKIDLSSSSLSHLAQVTGQTTAQITTDVNKATTATKTAWASYGDAITAFSTSTVPVTAKQISDFYAQQELQAGTFTQNVQKAIADGYSPQLISQIIQAGPAQASQLLQGLVSNEGSGLQKLSTQALSAMSKLGGQAVEQARITQLAVSSRTSGMASDLTNAMAIDQAKLSSNAKGALTTLAATFTGGLPALQAIAKEYGIALPNGLTAAAPATTTAANGQLAAFYAALNAAKPVVLASAGAAAGAVPDAITQTVPAVTTAAAKTTGSFTSQWQSLIGGAPLLGGQAATAVAGGASSSTAPAKAGDKNRTDYTTHVTQSGGHADSRAAGKGAADAGAEGASGESGKWSDAGDKLIRAMNDGLGGHDDLIRRTVSSAIDAAVSEANSRVNALQSVGASLIEGLAKGMGSSAATSAVQSAAQTAVTTAQTAANAHAQSNSPSRLMADTVGTDLSLGIAKGMVSALGLGAITTSAKTAVNTAATGARGPMPSVGVPALAGGPGVGSVTLYSQPSWTIHGDPSASTLAQMKKLQDDHDENLVNLLYARGGVG